MISRTLFEKLDLDRDGRLSRSELYEAAVRLGWHWPEAPFYALLDLLTIPKPICADTFDRILNQTIDDPLGPYGRVLLNSPCFKSDAEDFHHRTRLQKTNRSENQVDDNRLQNRRFDQAEWRNRFQQTRKKFSPIHLSRDEAVLLVLDPQRAFTRGVWMRSIGTGAEADVEPIGYAFGQCANSLIQNEGKMPVMFTRCPFPPESYPWDDQLAEIIDRNQLYFIKPGNSVLFPPTNGFKEWMVNCIEMNRRKLVIGGCTLNSCVRVSAIEAKRVFQNRNLQVIVDLQLCGARAQNFKPSPLFKGLSAVDSAVRQMSEAGVKVVNCVNWG
jgi:nicotinamidase-related amidase